MTDQVMPLLKIMQLTASSDDDDSSSEKGVVELPEHLIYSIFLKLPNKTLVRFLSLSKHWNETFTSRRFSMDQKMTSPGHLVAAILYIRYNYEKARGQYYAHKLYGSHCQPDLQDRELSCPVQNYDNYCCSGWFDFLSNDRWLGDISCDGLVGIIHLKGDSLYDWYSIVIWNPYTGRHKDVLVPQPPCYVYKSERRRDTKVVNSFKGFGYDATVNDYKIVVIDMIDYSSYASRVMIRGLNKSKRWRAIHCVPSVPSIPQQLWWHEHDVVSVDGDIWWIAMNSVDGSLILLRFNLYEEKLSTVSFPPDWNINVDIDSSKKMCWLTHYNESLYLICKGLDAKIYIGKLVKQGDTTTWKLRVIQGLESLVPMGFSSNRSFIVRNETNNQFYAYVNGAKDAAKFTLDESESKRQNVVVPLSKFLLEMETLIVTIGP